jgi:hypothetical protein
VLLVGAQAGADELIPTLELTMDDTACVVDYDNGTYAVGTSGGNLYVINEAGEYTVTALGTGKINDIRIEHPFIAVATVNYVIKLSLVELTASELWRVNKYPVAVDVSEDGTFVTYLSRTLREVGVLNGSDGSVISSDYVDGYSWSISWLDATADMEYIAITREPCLNGCGGTQSGVALYRFDGSTLVKQWEQRLIYKYDITEVRISENKDYIAVATSSGTYMKLVRMSDGAILWSHNTPGKEQYACDGDVNLNYVIGANQDWSPPYAWFILKNIGETGCEVVDEGSMSGRINDLDSNHDASLLAFGSDGGEFLLLRRSDDVIETVFDEDIDKFIDAIEIGDISLLVGGVDFINIYPVSRPILPLDIKPGSCPNPLNTNTQGKGRLPMAILGTEDFDVNDIDTLSIKIEEVVVPIKQPSIEDVAAPVEEDECTCQEVGPDGFADLVIHFSRREIISALGLGAMARDTEVPITVTGELLDGTQFEATDCVRLIARKD